jgi:hypothetical protein
MCAVRAATGVEAERTVTGLRDGEGGDRHGGGESGDQRGGDEPRAFF